MQQSQRILGSDVVLTSEWEDLCNHVSSIDKTTLKDMLKDDKRTDSLIKEYNGIYLDMCRERVSEDTMKLLYKLAEKTHLQDKIKKMFEGEKINETENRAVLHVATRARRDEKIYVDGKEVVRDVWQVLDKIKQFSEKVRSGQHLGVTGKPLKNVVAIGIGGSFLGPLFVHTALQTDKEAMKESSGRTLRFLANVDPIDVASSLEGLEQEDTLVVIISKTFTTAETMLNARTLRHWLVSKLGEESVSKHMIAVSTNLEKVKEFGIDTENTFGFWDWIGGRYSVCSAVGMVPLCLQYGSVIIEKFLLGASDMDKHFLTEDLDKNLPVLLGLISVWNTTFLGYQSRAILPYCQALSKFVPHIQQVSMESNGKSVDMNGKRLTYNVGEIDFGEPGTNGQHSFYQLIHQGRVIPCEFIGVMKSQQHISLENELVSNHDELMSNFFAQPDVLACGKDEQQLKQEGVPEHLISHKVFSGNRPSLSLLLPELDAYMLGQLLAMYEHRTVVQGFIWGINSFDQWGVELGKILGVQIRKAIHHCRTSEDTVKPESQLNSSTRKMLNKYLKNTQ